MATSVQFLANPVIKPVIFAAGRSDTLRRLSIEKISEKLRIDPETIDAHEVSVKQLLIRLASPPIFGRGEVVVYENANIENLQPLDYYVSHPTVGFTLILTAGEVKRPDGARWIPSTDRVQYVDCNPLTEESLLKFCQVQGLPEDDARWLINRYYGELDDIIRIIETMFVFKKPWPAHLVRQVSEPQQSKNKFFDKYQVLDTGNDGSIVRQMRRRLTQLAVLASFQGTRLPIVELANRAEMEPFLVKRLMPLVINTTPEKWLANLDVLLSAEDRTKENQTGVREYIQALLT